MGNPLVNLGDYNIARDALKAAGGSWDKLYKSIGKTAVFKTAPFLLLAGGIIWKGSEWTIKKAQGFIKERRRLIENEPALKEEFVNAFEGVATSSEDSQFMNCNAKNEEEECR